MHSVRDSRWRKIECSAVGAIDFMIMVSGFHDYRIKTISYDAERDRCEIFLQYDTGTDGIIMRFSNIYHMGYTPMCGLADYDMDWIFSSDME